MQYFQPEFNTFFKELAANNHKDWMDVNRKSYEEFAREPFYKLISDLIEEIKNHQTLEVDVKSSVFRMNNDVRFSKDKSLYKLHMGGSIVNGGRKNFTEPGLYIQLSPGESFIASGIYKPEKEHLYKIRKGISDNPSAFSKLLKDNDFNNKFGGFNKSQVNKIIPKEFKAAAEKQSLIFNKQFFYSKTFENGEDFVLQDNLKEIIMQHYFAAKPMNDFLRNCL